MLLMVPEDLTPYPSLGEQLCDFIEKNMVFGPGDLRGKPLELDDERRLLIWRLYEVFPKSHEKAGRRRFKRAAISLPKGLGKTELAAIIAACELHPEAPVRCVGWTKGGEPIGGGVTDPYIPMVAYTQEQSDELAFSALRVMLEQSYLKDDFDIGLERILRKRGDGRAEALSSNPNARDGARTTFAVLDETHRWVLPRQKHAHTVMQTNIPKRKIADGWMLEVTTAPEPGAGSVAEGTMDYARAVLDGRVTDSNLFFFHRQASDAHDLTTHDGRIAALEEASGAAVSWRDIDGIESLWRDPNADVSYLERVYCNRLVKGSTQAFDIERWKALANTPLEIRSHEPVTLGFDGSQSKDSTALIGTHVATGYQWVVGLWERPTDPVQAENWKVPSAEVDETVAQAFKQFQVFRLYADPPYWRDWVSKWTGQYGEDRVHEWYTNRPRAMAAALEGFHTAITDGSVTHDGNADLTRHLGNSRRMNLSQVDEQGRPLWVIQKERPDSPHKIDAAMAAVLSWEARTDAIAAGALKPVPKVGLFFLGGRV